MKNKSNYSSIQDRYRYPPILGNRGTSTESGPGDPLDSGNQGSPLPGPKGGPLAGDEGQGTASEIAKDLARRLSRRRR